MDGQPLPEGTSSGVEAALHDAIGMHGPWVLGVETYTDDGEPQLTVVWDSSSTAWTKLGIARALLLDLEVPFRRSGDDAS